MQFVRVSDKQTGHHYSILESAVDPQRHNVLKQDAVDRNGRPLPPKLKVPKGGDSAEQGTTTNPGEADGSAAAGKNKENQP